MGEGIFLILLNILVCYAHSVHVNVCICIYVCVGRGRGEYHRSASYSGDDYGGVSGVSGGGEGGRGGGYYYRGGGVGGVGEGGGNLAGVGTVGEVWNTEGRGMPIGHYIIYMEFNHYIIYIFKGRGSRALRDGNWRSPTTPDEDPGWGNQRQQPSSPGMKKICGM